MTLTQAKRLKPGESFSVPSSNPHDANGKRIYTVMTSHPNFHTVDQHGYQTGAGKIGKWDKEWFARAEKVVSA